MSRNQVPRRRAVTCAEISLFPRRKAGEAAERKAKKGEAQPVRFDRKSIEALFGKPQAEAASDLGIALTTLKHLCRKMGIVRWPYQRWPRGAPARSSSCSAPDRMPSPSPTPAEWGHAAAPAEARQNRCGSCFDEEETDGAASEAQTISRQDPSCSRDGEYQVTDTAPTPTPVSSASPGLGATAPGPCSRPELLGYALTGAWLDRLPPSRPDGIWQLHAAWLAPGEELAVEPEFDAVLAHLAATPMPLA